MPADVIQVQYETLQEIAAIWGRAQERHQKTREQLQRSVERLQDGGWVGHGAQAFFTEMEQEIFPALDRLIHALGEGQRTTLQIVTIFREAEEEAAQPFRQLAQSWTKKGASEGGAAGTEGHPDQRGWLQRLLDVGEKIVEYVDKFGKGLSVAALPLVLAGLRVGARYADEVIIDLPDWLAELGISRRWLRGLVGLSGHLNHIKGSNMARHIIGQIDVGPLDWAIFGIKGTLATLQSWHRHAQEYASYHDPTLSFSAHVVDGILAFIPAGGDLAGSIGGMAAGAKIGAVIGGAVGTVVPGVGNAVGAAGGAIIGGVLGSIAGGWVGEEVGKSASSWVETHYRERLIRGLDSYLVQPVADGISAALQLFQQGNQPQYQALGGW